ncbi:MAG TPA: hypothetical protein VGC13_28025 [Longimicrobium sp.]|jgi:hypothetical protein|uniref:hypothetical protein n=1 Tax=Longimicrobium sp. TaxID=2029185 RepID=UPI002ED89A28
MNPPRYRSVAVHWPRLLAGCAVMTGLLILAAAWEPAAPVLDSPLLSMLCIGAMMAGVVGFGRPWAEFELRDEGVLRREGLVFSLFRRASWMPWAAIERCDLAEELDGSRSLTLHTRHGAAWKLWEKYGGDFDAFHRELATRLERRSAAGADAAAPMRSAWDGGGARIAVGVLAVAWVALGVATVMGPAEGRGARLARLAAVGLLLAPLLIRAFFGRRGASAATHPDDRGAKSP